jgi:Uri superfamily endonuclease
MFTRADQKGVYSLLIELKAETPIQIGKLGRITFPAGFYVYTGSAMGNGASGLRGRITRHLSDKKKNFWHIDYFLSNEFSKVLGVVFSEAAENKEHDVVRALKENAKVICRKFGASDCEKSCMSHLLYLGQNPSETLGFIEKVYKKLELEPITIDIKNKR